MTSSSRRVPAGPTVLLIEDDPEMAVEILAKLKHIHRIADHDSADRNRCTAVSLTSPVTRSFTPLGSSIS